VIAERIHDASPRTEKPYVVFRCGSVPEADVEGTIFGDARGTAGLLETAHEGTLLLADVELLPRGAQERLLRLLRAQATGPGKKKTAGPNVRVLCASSADLRAAVESRDFAEKLYALVATLAIRVPPLRERKTEIPVLADHLLRAIADPLGVASPTVTPEASRLLCEFAWPRNVSDLRNVMEYALALSDDGTIGPSELPVSFTDAARAATPQPAGQPVVLRIAPEGLSFCLPPAPIVSLSRRGPLRRVLLRLAEAHERQRGSAITADDLLAAGWPGEKPIGQSAEGRVRTAIWMLRRMGLHDLLVTRDDGYLLAGDVAIERPA
jgi:DNA-binding NtrC family response regulator